MITESIGPQAPHRRLRQRVLVLFQSKRYPSPVMTFTQQIRGRGARSNASGRFESQAREAFDDGWTPDEPDPKSFSTTASPEKAKVIVTHNDSPDVGFSASINPYRGCEHGCVYSYDTHLRLRGWW
jgi:hypothetical protein